MFTLIVVGIIIGALIYYVSSLDFEIGTGFSEKKKNAREGEYRVVGDPDEDEQEDKKLLK